jgi:DNA-binding HxlR family transcriptional regulator
LTERGKGLRPVLKEMGLWGAKHARHYGKSIGHWRNKIDADLAPARAE